MVRHIDYTDPTGVIVSRLAPRGQVSTSTSEAVRGEFQGWKVLTSQASPTSTATANAHFQNPESVPVYARVSYFIDGSAGTGTVDIGTGTAGTGDDNSIFDGGTLTAGWHSRFTFAGTVAASATAGNLDLGIVKLAASGSGGDSVVVKFNDTTTSTMGTFDLVVEYIDARTNVAQ